MKYCFSIIWLMIICSCSNKSVQAPVVYYKPDSLFSNCRDSMILVMDSDFKKEYRFFLLTTRQPVPLQSIERKGKKIVYLNTINSFCEGPASICCTSESGSFFYPVQLVYRQQDKIVAIKKDYRSPKTVNPDSSLLQQRILFNMDGQRIILPLTGMHKGESTAFFYSDSIRLAPVTATYLIDSLSPVTSIYLQPGTNTHLALMARYNSNEKCFQVQTLPLKDHYNNIVADGTLVAFIYTDGTTTSRTEAAVYLGVATVKIPANDNNQLTVKALINDMYSSPITITTAK